MSPSFDTVSVCIITCNMDCSDSSLASSSLAADFLNSHRTGTKDGNLVDRMVALISLNVALHEAFDLSDLADQVLGTIALLRLEDVSKVSQDGGELRYMFGHASDLLMRVDHDVGGLVKARGHLGSKGGHAKDAGYERELRHLGDCWTMREEVGRAEECIVRGRG